jgi:hypothetical protein
MIDRQIVEALSKQRGQHLISFYIPTHRVAGIEKDRIRYKNMLARLQDVLLARGLDEPTSKRLLATATAKLEDEAFWQQQSDCLGVFIDAAETQFHYLPLELEELYFVGDKFYVLPLLPFAQEKDIFYLLALSQNAVKVYEGSRYTMAELEKNKDFPDSLASVLHTYESEKSLQHHNAGGTVYHGQGGGQQMEKARYREYLRQVDAGIQTMACDDDQTPLLLYTTPELAGIYREVNTYPHLQEGFIHGNAEKEDLGTLHEKAWSRLATFFEQQPAAVREYFGQRLANQEASYNVHEIVPAAMAGQIDTLFLVKNQEHWGVYDASKHRIVLHEERQADSQPLYHDAAVATWQQGGQVELCNRDEMPRAEANANAIFRYAATPA